MGGVYAVNPPGFRVSGRDREKIFLPDIDGNFTDGIPGNPGDPFYLRPDGYWNGGNDWQTEQIPDATQDYLVNDPTGKSTGDLIAEDGTVKTFLPPNSRHFILGPLVDGYVQNHNYDNYSNIGYIQKDTRQFVLLARIQGQFTADLHQEGARVWDGTAGQLTIYNSNFTLDMAEWFRDQITAGTITNNVPYFYSGGVPQPPISGGPNCPNCPPNMFGGVGAGTPKTGGGFGQGGPGPKLGTPQGPPNATGPDGAGYPWGPTVTDVQNMSEADKKRLRAYLSKMGLSYGDIANANVMDMGVDATAAIIGLGIAGVKLLYDVSTFDATNLINAITDNPYTRDNEKKNTERIGDAVRKGDAREAGQSQAEKQEKAEASKKLKDAEQEAKDAEASGDSDRIDRAYDNYQNAVKNNQRVNAKWKNQRKLPGYKGESYKPKFVRNRKPLTETRTPKQRKILREIKQPIKTKEAPTKYKMNFEGRYSSQNTPDKTGSNISDDLVMKANARGQRWRTSDKYWSGYETTEKMNIIQDRTGHGQQAWDHIVNENANKKEWRDAEIQEKLNMIAHEKAMLKENPDYKTPFGGVEVSTTEKNIQNFERVNKIKKVVADTRVFNNKDIKPEYPADEIQKQQELAKLVKDTEKKEYEHKKLQTGERASAYYKRLDPTSADSMPDAAYPQIDDLKNKVRKQAK